MANKKRIRIAFVKFGGLSAGGTERWLQMMAANLSNKKFDIDYFYCDSSPYIGSDYVHPNTDEARLNYMTNHGVKLIKFSVKAKDITKPTHDWIETDFWDLFNPNNYDLVQTAKAGHQEYPYFKIPLPIVEYVTLSAGIDKSPNIICSIHLSNWQRNEWVRSGGNFLKSRVIPIPAEEPCTNLNLRARLGINSDVIIAGFHQRVDNNIFSPIPLNAFKTVCNKNHHFLIMGGGSKYHDQARALNLKNIHFIDHSGSNHEISMFLNTLDIFAHGRSDGETFGTVFAEAMMHELPCISHKSNIANAQPETIGPAGYFANDLNDYSYFLSLLLHDKSKRIKIGKKGKKHALKYYSIKSCANTLERTYYDLLGLSKDHDLIEKLNVNYYFCEDQYLKIIPETSEIIAQPIKNQTEFIKTEVYKFFLFSKKSLLSIGIGSANFLCIAMSKVKNPISIRVFESSQKKINLINEIVNINNWEDSFFISQNIKKTISNNKYDLIHINYQNIKNILPYFKQNIRFDSNPLILVENFVENFNRINLFQFQSLLEGKDYYVFGISCNLKIYKNVNYNITNLLFIMAVHSSVKNEIIKKIIKFRSKVYFISLNALFMQKCTFINNLFLALTSRILNKVKSIIKKN